MSFDISEILGGGKPKKRPHYSLGEERDEEHYVIPDHQKRKLAAEKEEAERGKAELERTFKIKYGVGPATYNPPSEEPAPEEEPTAVVQQPVKRNYKSFIQSVAKDMKGGSWVK